jgi:alpha-galactosidase
LERLAEVMMKTSSVPEGRPDNIELEFYERAGLDAARYVSDTTVREEVLDNGRLVGLYWSGSGQILREVGPGLGEHSILLDSRVHPNEVFELEIDGQLLHNHWDWTAAYERPGSKPGTVEGVIELRHHLRPVSVKAVTRLDGSPILVRWLEITNTGSAPAALANVSPCSGVLWDISLSWNPSVGPGMPSLRLGYLRSENYSEEGDFEWVSLPPENYRVERTRGKNYGPPYFILRNDVTGEFFFLGLAWSGNWFAEFTHKSYVSQAWAPLGSELKTVLSFRTGPVGPAPLRVISPGETVSSPEVHLGPVHGTFDEAIQAWHEHMRGSVIPPRPEGKEMYTIAGHVVEYPGEWILREIDIAAEMGIEAFLVDAGWYGDSFANWVEQRGDWYEGNWLPGGIAGVREYAHAKGMLFGLWMEPEVAGNKSNVARKHPDWLLTTDNGRPVTQYGTMVLNLADPEAARFVEQSVISVIRDLQLDFFKIDYNVRVHEGGQTVRDGFAEHESWRHFETLYRTFDRVRQELPQVALENCAGGGGRNDLGMLSRFHYACESDFAWFPLNIRAINGLSLFLPPEAICYYQDLDPLAHLMTDLDTHMRVALFANVCFVGFGAQDADRTMPYYVKVKRYIELAKSFCYPIMAERPLVYHHTPGIGVSRPAEWCVLEYALCDRTRAYAGVFRLSHNQDDEEPAYYLFRPQSLDLSKDYEVTMDNRQVTFRASGLDLAQTGVQIRLDSALTSELLLFSAACD